jgi:PPP family 3-phenylpropionic acid transporter
VSATPLNRAERALAGFYFSYFAYLGAFAPYLALFLDNRGFAAWDIAVATTLMQAMRLVAPFAWSQVADSRGNALELVRMALAGALASTAVLYFDLSVGGVLIVLTIAHFFSCPALPLVESMTLRGLGDNTQRYGAIRLWGSIGFICAVQATGVALDLYAAEILLPITLGLLFLTWVGSAMLPHPPAATASAVAEPIPNVSRRGEVAASFIAFGSMSVAHGAFYTYYTLYLAQSGYTKSLIGALWCIGVVAEILLFLVLGRLTRSPRLRGVLLASFACATVRFAVIGWAVESLWLLVCAQLLHAMTFGAFHWAALAAVHRWYPGTSHARGQALYSSITFGAGGMLGVLLSGWAWGAFGPAWTFGFGAAAGFLGLLLIGWKFKG